MEPVSQKPSMSAHAVAGRDTVKIKSKRLSVSIYRYNPDVDKAPYMQDY